MSNYRGQQSSFRSRGGGSRGRGRGGYASYGTDQPPAKDIMEGLRPNSLTTVDIPVPAQDAENVEIRDCLYIGSYNWLDETNPTILVPGSPPQWTDRPFPYQVAPDVGLRFVDQGGHRFPNAVLWPLVATVNKLSDSKQFDWSSVDFVTDRNNLRKLLRWVKGDRDRDFRIDIQLAGETVLFNRWQERTEERMSGRTYGFNFEKASTRVVPGCEGSASHHRIVTYDLNGLKMVVRFEVDACLPPPAAPQGATPTKPTTKQPISPTSVDDLAQMLSSTNLKAGASTDAGNSLHGLTILEGGETVAPDYLVELTTRSAWIMKSRGFDWEDAYPQLWLSQTTNHMLAIHDDGRFTSMERRRLAASASQKEQPRLKKLRLALDVIKGIALKHGEETRLSLVCVSGTMKVYRRNDQKSCLPQTALQLFELPAA